MIKFHWLSHSSGRGSKCTFLLSYWSPKIEVVLITIPSLSPSFQCLCPSVDFIHLSPILPWHLALLSPPACVSPAPPPSFPFHILYPSLFLWVKSCFPLLSLAQNRSQKHTAFWPNLTVSACFHKWSFVGTQPKYVFAHCLWLSSCHGGGVVWLQLKPCGPQRQK